MGKRSPVLGFNHNFKHRGLIFHVQTEDSGVDNPHLFTHLFHGGVIITTRKIDYDEESEEEVVKSLMKSQHKAVVKGLKDGTFDDKIDAYLGNHEDLLPRKPGSLAAKGTGESQAAPSPSPEPSQASPPVAEDTTPANLAETAHVDEDPTDRNLAEGTETDANPVVEEAPRVAQGKARGPRQSDTVMDIPDIPDGRDWARGDRAPTERAPTSRDFVEEEPARAAQPAATLGDPTVTFAARPKGKQERESSGSYHIKQPEQGKSDLLGRARPTTRPPRSASMAARPAGKAANPEPGRPKSKVVVSRPAVIIGAPPKMVGKGRARTARDNTEGKGLFGKDTISEKSLDDVIMAYLSEEENEGK